jgi:hypothetical protein
VPAGPVAVGRAAQLSCARRCTSCDITLATAWAGDRPGKAGPDLERFQPWLAAPEDLGAAAGPRINRTETATETASPEYGHAARWHAQSRDFRILTIAACSYWLNPSPLARCPIRVRPAFLNQ